MGPLQQISPSLCASRLSPVDTSTTLNVVLGQAKPHDPSRGSSKGFKSPNGDNSDMPQPEINIYSLECKSIWKPTAN